MKFLKGLAVGSIAGGLYGLLIAPRPGVETRAALSDYFQQIKDDATDVNYQLNNLQLALHRLTDEGLPSVQTAINEIQLRLNSYTQEAKPYIRRIESSLDDLNASIDSQEEILLN